jgi:hypothetical protein
VPDYGVRFMGRVRHWWGGHWAESLAAWVHRRQVAVSEGWHRSQAFAVARTVGESRELAPGEWAGRVAEALAQMVRRALEATLQ